MSNQPLRVFHLIKSLGRGGAEMLLTDGPMVSDPQHFRYGFGYFLANKNALVPDLERAFDHVVCFPARGALGMLGQVRSLARHLRSWRADLVHCHLPLAGATGRLAAALAGVPVVYTEHNAIERYHPATRLAAKATWRLQRSVIAVSRDVQQSIARNLGERVPVRVIRNGVSLERFSRSNETGLALRRQLGIPEASPVIGTVAVFRKQKRLDLWLTAAASVLRERPDVRFLLVGDGPMRPQVEQQIAGSALAGKVLLPGLQAEVIPYLCAMNVYFMSSDFEGVPIALLEAMSMELPLVVTDAGGMPEVVEPTISGVIVPRGDAHAMAQALRALLDDRPEHRATLGRNARRRVAAEFSTQRMMTEIEEVYRDAIKSR